MFGGELDEGLMSHEEFAWGGWNDDHEIHNHNALFNNTSAVQTNNHNGSNNIHRSNTGGGIIPDTPILSGPPLTKQSTQPLHEAVEPLLSVDQYGRPHYKGLYEVSADEQIGFEDDLISGGFSVNFFAGNNAPHGKSFGHNGGPVLPTLGDDVKFSIDEYGRAHYKGLYAVDPSPADALNNVAGGALLTQSNHHHANHGNHANNQNAHASHSHGHGHSNANTHSHSHTQHHSQSQHHHQHQQSQQQQHYHHVANYNTPTIHIPTAPMPAPGPVVPAVTIAPQPPTSSFPHLGNQNPRAVSEMTRDSARSNTSPKTVSSNLIVPTLVTTTHSQHTVSVATTSQSAGGAASSMLAPSETMSSRVIGGRVEKPRTPRKKPAKKVVTAAQALEEKDAGLMKELEQFAGKPKIRRYSNATASRFCHVCARSLETVRAISCFNTVFGVCRKIICEKCFEMYGWDWEAASKPGARWSCVHCKGICPERAQCNTYKKTNQRRRLKGLERRKKLEEILLQGGGDGVHGLIDLPGDEEDGDMQDMHGDMDHNEHDHHGHHEHEHEQEACDNLL
eukprot:CAMPEP_0184697902 /NCGR_PEP_ID=MMETSP0313-20130426/4691_1 /TAXON_ID=2792 /ORGANISM="Porphyridium aerugineum, Strain SAG 1380-2" /LENGTH=562 /DNA_ID=CAMNT_0027156749 /DNA_START=200 /DNA_END=1888 /DNA_ORIENTATION=+